MRVALAQMNSHLGNFSANKKTIVNMCRRAVELRADLVVFPECSLFGYYPMDLLERPEVVEEQLKELNQLVKQIPDNIAVLVGAITKNSKKRGKPYYNSAVLLKKNKPFKIFPKQLLPAYDVFDEGRFIEPAEDLSKNIFSLKGKKVLVTVCEDIWGWNSKNRPTYSHYKENPIRQVKPKSVDVIVNLSASPFTDIKAKTRREVVKNTASLLKAPLVYVNMVGAQDEIIFDGGSFAVDAKGRELASSVQFQEDLNIVDLELKEGGLRETIKDKNELNRQAIVLGLRDFVQKIGLSSFHLGLSGGIDSAVVACLAVDALGPTNVKVLALPTKFNSDLSLTLAERLAKNLEIELVTIPIQQMYEKMIQTFDEALGHQGFDLVNENLQARIRGAMLMGMSNFTGSLLLATSNKSELAMGYSTLYGDMNGGLMPIGDLLKTEVFDLARHYNKDHELIPEEIITRPPSAELAPNQKDSDSLPPYEKLDPVVKKFVDGFSSPRGALDRRVLKALFNSEFKRWQSAPVLKVSEHAFGMGRRLPIAHAALISKMS